MLLTFLVFTFFIPFCDFGFALIMMHVSHSCKVAKGWHKDNDYFLSWKMNVPKWWVTGILPSFAAMLIPSTLKKLFINVWLSGSVLFFFLFPPPESSIIEMSLKKLPKFEYFLFCFCSGDTSTSMKVLIAYSTSFNSSCIRSISSQISAASWDRRETWILLSSARSGHAHALDKCSNFEIFEIWCWGYHSWSESALAAVFDFFEPFLHHLHMIMYITAAVALVHSAALFC